MTFNEAVIQALQPRLKRRPPTLKDLKVHKSKQPPIPDDDEDPINRPSDGDEWCRKMNQMDEHLEDLRTASKLDD